MQTRYGIEYDLKLSHYSCTFEKVRFIFSSEFHMKQFLLRREINQKEISESLSRRFKFCINVPLLADIALYEKIETRGFLLQNEKGEFLRKESLILNGERATKQE